MTFPNRYLQRVNGAIVDGIPTIVGGPAVSGQIVALGANGMFDSSMIPGASGGAFVTSVNSLTGALTVSGSQYIGVTVSGNIIDITNLGVTSVNGQIGAVTVSASGGGISGAYVQTVNGISGAVVVAGSQSIGVSVSGNIIDISLLTPPIIATMRGTNSINSMSANPLVVSLPVGSQANDFAIIQLSCLSTTPTTPSGWTQNTSATAYAWNSYIFSKILTSADITAGNVSFTLSGSNRSIATIITFVGATGGIREIDWTQTRNDGSSNTPFTVNTSSNVTTTDFAVYFNTAGATFNSFSMSVNRGILQIADALAPDEYSQIYTERPAPGGSYGVTFTTVASGTGPLGAFGAIVIVEGIPSSLVSGPYVQTVNGISGAITIAGANGLSVGVSGSTITLTAPNASGGGSISGAYVQTINNVSGVISIIGSGVSQIGNVITISVSGGGGGSFPFPPIQEATFQNASNAITVTFPKALASGGATAWLLVSTDGSQTITMPTGWTVDLNIAQPTYSRFILAHKTSAGDTTATFSTGGTATYAIYFFELPGTRTLDASSTGGQVDNGVVVMPSITPTPGAAVFAMVAALTNGVVGSPLITPTIDPTWRQLGIQAVLAAGGGRFLVGHMLTIAAVGSTITPPAVCVSDQTLYPSGGMAYATFSII